MKLFSLLCIVVLALIAASSVSSAQKVTTNYDEDTSFRYLYAARLAYCGSDQQLAWNDCDACKTSFPHAMNVSAFATSNGVAAGYAFFNIATNEIFFALRGTVDFLGWVADFDFFQIPYTVPSGGNGQNVTCSGCRVHKGFFESYTAVAQKLLPHVQALADEHPTATLVATGHSMGAAQSQFAFVDLLLKIKSNAQRRLYNYGCPRVGNKEFAAFVDAQVAQHSAQHFRVVDATDPVPHLPMDNAIWNKVLPTEKFQHTATEIWYPNASALVYKQCVGDEDPHCSDSVNPIVSAFSFGDHVHYMTVPMGCFAYPVPQH